MKRQASEPYTSQVEQFKKREKKEREREKKRKKN